MAAAGRSVRLASLLVLGWLGLACAKPDPWRVEVAGCETWAAGPTCSLAAAGETELKLWVAGAADFRAELDGRAVTFETRPAAGGQFFVLKAPADARRLRLSRRRGPVFELALGPSWKPGWYPEVSAAYSNESAEKVRELLAKVGADEPLDRAFKRLIEARLANRAGDRRTAVRLSGQAGELFTTAGLPGFAIAEHTFAAQQASEDARFDVSRQQLALAARQLELLARPGLLPWRAFFSLRHLQVLLAFRAGDVRGALKLQQELAAVQPHEIATLREQLDIEDLHVQMLAELGRFEEALGIQERLLQQPLPEKDRANLMHNYGWLALLAQQAEQSNRDPRPFLAWAWEYYGTKGGGQDQLKILLNQAAAELEAGRAEEAQRYLVAAEARLGAAGPRQLFDYQELKGQLYLAQSLTQASLEQFERLDRDAALRRLPGLQWRALVGRARAQAQAGHAVAAIATFEQAERLETHELIFIPIDQGRETFLARRGQATRRHLELLLHEGQVAKALELVRRRRAQTLRLLQRDELLAALSARQRQLWENTTDDYRRLQREIEAEADGLEDLPRAAAPRESRRAEAAPGRGEELARLIDTGLAGLGLPVAMPKFAHPRPGELLLAFFPLEDSWLLFAQADEGPPRLVSTPGKDLRQAAGALLGQIAPAIAASRRLKILPWGDLDYHAVLVGGKPLVAWKPIAYGIDAGTTGETSAPVATAERRAVLVADSQTLRRAVREVQMASLALEKNGFAIGSLLKGGLATPAAVRAGLEDADYFHFAGHSYFDGEAGSQSRLELYGGALQASDVFALARVPRQVLLSSCAGGQAHRAAEVEGLGLAQAFVLAGAGQVLATTREVDDAQAAELVASLYRHLFAPGNGERDLAEALQAAQLELAAAGKGPDWQAFRVFEP